ncbi:MAG: hypothetical protein ACLUI3_00965 [Christensenellales bacterium]
MGAGVTCTPRVLLTNTGFPDTFSDEFAAQRSPHQHGAGKVALFGSDAAGISVGQKTALSEIDEIGNHYNGKAAKSQKKFERERLRR